MQLEGEQLLLRVYFGSTDQHGFRTAAEALVERAAAAGLAGATLLRGICGLSFSGELLCPGAWSLIERVPVIVEIVDSAEQVAAFLPAVAGIVPRGAATLERAHVLLRRDQPGAPRHGLRMPGAVSDLSTVPALEELPAMQASLDGRLLRVFVSEADTWQGQPLFRTLVAEAQRLGLAGATVLHGTMGFGTSTQIHTSKLADVSTGLPVVVEIVDTAEKIELLLPLLDECIERGLVTVESVRVLRYGRPGAPR